MKTKCNFISLQYLVRHQEINDLKEGASTLTFDCSFAIKSENLWIGGYPYTKTDILTKQNYSDNLLCWCD